MKSRHLKHFIKELKYKNRILKKSKVLELIEDKSTNPQTVIAIGETLYRARIVTDEKKVNKKKDFYGYNAKESFVPPAHLTPDARANYRYIPYLYCANHAYIALAEVRPYIGAKVSIATITVKEPLKLLDFTMQAFPEKRMSKEKQNMFEDLSELFFTPVAKDDNCIDYIPTQFIAEYVKQQGYDGIIFSSSVTPEFRDRNPERYNIVVFNYNKCEVIKSNLFEIERTYVQGKQIDTDQIQLDVRNQKNEDDAEILNRLKAI